MKDEKLKEKIDEMLKSIKENSKDENLANDQLNELMSLKGQLDVKPVRLCVEEKDVLKEYDFDSYRYVRCKGGILYQMAGGYSVYVTPRMVSLYKHLDQLLSLKDDYDNLSEELKNAYSTLVSATQFVMSLPVCSPSSDKMFFGIAGDIAERLNDMVSELMDKDLQEETHEENAEFENTQDLLNNITK